MALRRKTITAEEALSEEINRHARLCVREYSAFVGRRKALSAVKTYLQNENQVLYLSICNI